MTFEFVEHEEVSDHEHTKRIIDEYRRLGFQIALDDFGTGYSRLAKLRPDIVKLDQELIVDCVRNEMTLAVIAAIIGLGKGTGIKVVVEGVERVDETGALSP